MTRCSIKLLGSMQVMLDGELLQSLESAKVRALLAFLAVENEQVHERETLAGLFWPEMSEAQARHGLSQSLYNLRQTLGDASKPEESSSELPFFRVTPHSVQLDLHSGIEVDVVRFMQLIAQVRRHTHRLLKTCPSCPRLLQQAEQLYQGEFLHGMFLKGCQDFEEWVLVWRERLHRQVCEALADLAAYYAGRAELPLALEVSQRWVHLDPLSEPAQRSLMRLLALDGQRTLALSHYAGFRRQLAGELNVEPAKETQQLYQRILDEETTQTSLPGMPGKLPVPLTPFIGRGDELAELTALLRDPQVRLITLLGAGGSGKTRLALQAAQTLRYDFPDGLFLVSLSGLSSSEAFVPALAASLGVIIQQNWGDAFEQLLGYLERKRLLVILDSFEEAPTAAALVSRLLQAAPGVQLLVTSRSRLNIQAEQVFLLEGLLYPASIPEDATLPDMESYTALQLFLSTARQVRADYSLTSADLPHLVRICQLVDGMPLGLVLAAGWLAALSPEEIAQEITQSLDFLSADWSDLPARQRSLRATLDHSWHMLSSQERQVFQRLSVFQGIFHRQAASQVVGVDASSLRALADKSMLQASLGSYRMHDLLRQYATEKLLGLEVEAAKVRDAHSAYFLERLPERSANLKSARRSATLTEMDAEVNDLQAAWKWAGSQENLPLLARSLEGLCLYHEMRVRLKEGVQACRLALSAIPEDAAGAAGDQVLRARLLLWQANFLVLSGDLETGRLLRQQAGGLLDQLEAQDTDARRPRALYWQLEGEAQSELKIKLDCYQRGITLYQEVGDPWRQARMLIWAGEYAMRLGDPTLAQQSQQEALRLARQLGEPETLLHSLRQTTFLYFLFNQFDKANQLIQETQAYLERVEELPLRANAEMYLGHMLTWNGRYAEAAQALERSIPKLRSLGYRYGVMYATFSLTIALTFTGDYERSDTMTQTSFPEAERGNFQREAAGMLAVQGTSRLAQGKSEQAIELFTESASRYRQMQFKGELGWALGGLALAQEMNQQPENALGSLIEALHLAENSHSTAAMLTCLPAMVLLLSHRGHLELALCAHRLAQANAALKNLRWYADLIGNEMSARWEALPAEQRAEIDASASQHTLFSIIPKALELLEAK